MRKAHVAALALTGMFGAPCILPAQSLSEHEMQLRREVSRIQGIDLASAPAWLAREAHLVDLAHSLNPQELPGFAGVWIDSVTHSLIVAVSEKVSDGAQRSFDRMGVSVEFVDHSMEELEAHMEALAASLPRGLARQVAVDVRRNGLLLKADRFRTNELADAAQRLLTMRGVTVPVRVEEFDQRIGFSAIIRGAEGTNNRTWDIQYPRNPPHICSAGFPTASGFVTAAHCGWTQHQILHSNGTHLGYVQGDAWASGNDTAIVGVSSGWWTGPYIYTGFGNPDVTVPSKWAALAEAPVGAMVCRYGLTTGGPHCGSVSSKNVSAQWTATDGSTIYMYGLSELSSICTDEGDSGGPVITTDSQAQGTLTGGVNNGCGGQAWTYGNALVAPISQHMLNHSATILTAHGPSAATVSNYKCPDMAHSGSGQFRCSIDHYNSQGLTMLSWSGASGWTSPTGAAFWGNCASGQTLSVTLQIFNPYGTYSRTSNFLCPTGPIQ